MDATRIIEPLYVCVYVPQYPAQVMLRLRRKAAVGPVVVMDHVASLEQVCSMNAHAVQLGLALGMTRAELENITGLTVLKRSLAEETLARTALLELAGGFTPRTEILQPRGVAFAMVLDMTGTTQLFGTTQKMLDVLGTVVTSLGFQSHLASSVDFHTAAMLACSAPVQHVIALPGRERDTLGPLSLELLPLTPQQAETLELWGLRTLADLAALPIEDLVVRLGQPGKRLQLLARGKHPHLMQPEQPVFELREYVSFDTPLDILDSLLFILGPMLDQLLARAASRVYALASVTITLGLEGSGCHQRKLKPALPVTQRDILLKLFHLDLQEHPPSAGILSILAEAEPGDRSKVQLGLFAPQLPESTRLDVTLARLSALVGENRVGSPRLLDTYRLDAFVMDRFTVPEGSAFISAPRQSLAIRRCRPPLPISMQQRAALPQEFCLNGKNYQVDQACGPWRTSGQWWSSEVWSSEEWDIYATTHQQSVHCMLMHDLLHQRWFVAGLYD